MAIVRTATFTIIEDVTESYRWVEGSSFWIQTVINTHSFVPVKNTTHSFANKYEAERNWAQSIGFRVVSAPDAPPTVVNTEE